MHTQDFPNLPPSICFVCERAEPGTVYVDTFLNFDPGYSTPLNGRKYVCGYCITDMAHQIGVFDDEREKHEDDLSCAADEIDALNTRIESYRALDEALKALTPACSCDEKQPKAKPKAKAPAKKAESAE